MTSFKTFPDIVAKYSLTADLDEQAPLTEWEARLKGLLTAKTKELAASKNPALKRKAEREWAELKEAVQLVSILTLFERLRLCLEQDKQETFEWHWGKREHQAIMPGPDDPLYEQYLDLKAEARKKWPGVDLGPARPAPSPAPAARTPRPTRRPSTAPAQTDERLLLLQEQLAAPLPFNPHSSGPKTTGRRPRGARDSTVAPLRTFQDLFDDPHTPVFGLKAAKDYFKQLAGNSDSRQPKQEVAFLLYFVSILVARVRLGVVITKLPDDDLIRGIKWGLDLPWLDSWTRELLLKALKTVPN